jgi:hypothetical protein
MTLDESMQPIVCTACNKEAPVREDAGPSGPAQVAPEQLHGLGWSFAAGGRGWVCRECSPAAQQ